METHKQLIWVYPEEDLYLQNLLNRIYPDDCGAKNECCDGGGGGGGGGSGAGIINKYEQFIFNANKQLLQGISSSYMDTFLIGVLNMINEVKQVFIDYTNNKYYVALQVILRQVDLLNRNKYLVDENTRLIAENLYLLNKPCNCNIVEFTIEPKIGIIANTAIKMEYIIYIQLYGVPDDGIFNISLLNQIKLQYDL